MLKQESEGASLRVDMQALVDAMVAPAIFYRENTVRYFNRAALDLLPGLKAGESLPERLWDEDFPFTCEANELASGTLYLIRSKQDDWSREDLFQAGRELRGCLSVLTMAESMLLPREDQTPEQQRLAREIDRSLYRLHRLTDHIDLVRQLEQQRGMARETLYREGPLDLAWLCGELGAQAADLARETGRVFRLDCREDCLVSRGDAILLQKMLLNLISNAIKAVGPGQELGLRLERREDRAVFTVWDSGPGMPPERMKNVFLPQKRRGLSRPEEGPGMGLRMVREIAALHRGVCMADNRPEGGLRVTISLPIRRNGNGGLNSTPAWGEERMDLVLRELSDALPSAVYGRRED